MKMKWTWFVPGILACMAAVTPLRAEDGGRIGGGANYWVALEDIDVDNVDESGLSYFVSYQYKAGLLGLELNAEMLPDRFGDDAVAPQAYLVFGSGIYVAAGIGVMHQHGEWADEPFYGLKAGLDLEVLPSLHLDLSANYRFNEKSDLGDEHTDLDTDTVFLGAALRLAF